jgi:hypothetical protein
MESPQNGQAGNAPSLDTVISHLVAEMSTPEEDVDRIVLQKATPKQWTCRIFRMDEDDFEGVFLSYD